MADTDESEDWVAGGKLEASAADLVFFAGSSVPIDTGSLPPAPEGPDGPLVA
jgi:hypothetical protein